VFATQPPVVPAARAERVGLVEVAGAVGDVEDAVDADKHRDFSKLASNSQDTYFIVLYLYPHI